MKKRLVRAALWLVTLGFLAYLFATVPFSRVLAAVGAAAPWTVPVVAAMTIVVFLTDTFAAWKTFSWFAAPVTFREALVVRGASYPLALVNYALGQGAFAFFLHKRKHVPFLRSAATVLLVMGINLLVLLFLATLGLALAEAPPPELAAQLAFVKTLTIAGYAGLAVYAALVVARPRFLRKQPVLDVLLSAGLAGYAKALAARLPHIVSLLVFAYLYLLAFEVRVPVVAALVYLPVAFLVAALPLPGQGFGAAQAAMVALFHRYAPGDPTAQKAAVLAAGMSGQVIAIVVQMLIGLPCLRSQLGRSLATAPPDPDAEP
jgi:hypothetical protein